MKLENLTEEQRSAVFTGSNVLVAAAAGSGKTAVLIERIVREMTRQESPIAADRLLVVTFTVAAAGEMRARLEKGLDDYCKAHPDDVAAVRQKILLQSAHIGTIDSFCISLVREHFDRLHLSPDFRIADEGESARINDLALHSVAERHFESEDGAFHTLLDLFGSTYDEGNLLKAVKELYEFSTTMPFPMLWLENAAKQYADNTVKKWKKRILARVVKELDDCMGQNETVLGFCQMDKAMGQKYMPVFEEYNARLLSLHAAAVKGDWNTVYTLCREPFSEQLKAVKSPEHPEWLLAAKVCKDRLKKIIGTKLAKQIELPENETDRLYLQIAPSMVHLISLAKEFGEELKKKYEAENLLTFSAVEHLALDLLCTVQDGEAKLREDAGELIKAYDEVLVDEYQDVNDLQNLFFRLLSAGGKNLFAVGDVKQSIYGFRGANPDNFVASLQSSTDYSEEIGLSKEILKRIFLHANFRSRADICAFTNHFFTRFMTKETCGIEYGESEKLLPCSSFPPVNAPVVEAHFLTSFGRPKENYRTESVQIADYIRSVMLSGEVIRDKETGQLRKAKYSDFAVIMRDTRQCLLTLAETLKESGIPVTYEKNDFLSCREIEVMLNLLSVISNPTRDVELLSVMFSPLFSFSADEVAVMRTGHKNEPVYSSVIRAAEKGDRKADGFLKELAEYRRLSVLFPLTGLLSRLYDNTDYLNVISLMDEGKARRANLLLLLDHAASYENSGKQGIDGFLRNIRKMPEKLNKAAAISGGSDSVGLMTTHHSKGLQYPICILAFLMKPFSTQESRSSLLTDNEDGVTVRYYDEQVGRTTPVSFRVFAEKARKKQLEEELRILYVAMTRAEDRLVMFFTGNKMGEKLESIAAQMESGLYRFSGDDALSAASYSDWLIPAILSHPDSAVLDSYTGIEIARKEAEGRLTVQFDEPRVAPVLDEEKIVEQSDNKMLSEIQKCISYGYRYAPLLAIESKASVSDMVHKAEQNAYEFTDLPDFMTKQGITATEKGTANHKVLQFMDFVSARADLEGELNRLYEWEFLSEAEYDAVSRSHIQAFVESKLFDRMCGSSMLRREMKFLTNVPAGKIHPGLDESLGKENIVVQGAVDSLFVENGKLILVDFKTDRVSSPDRLVASYREQLDIYARACEKIFELPVEEKIIYSLYLDRAIKL